MFTGLIEEIGEIKSIIPYQNLIRLNIQADKVLTDIQRGGSIAVDGVCLTVVEFSTRDFTVELGEETLRKTTLGALSAGKKVNLERPLRLSDRLGGHLVQGHVDGVGVLKEKVPTQRGFWLWFQTTADLMNYIVPKGFIGIDGISLTVVEIRETEFSVFLIPYTAQVTTLGLKDKGDRVNLEVDVVGKYIEKLIGHKFPLETSITPEFLQEHGFI